MRWPRRRVRLPAVDPEVLRATQESEQKLHEARKQMGEVRQMAAELREIRLQNNLAGWVARALGEHR